MKTLSVLCICLGLSMISFAQKEKSCGSNLNFDSIRKADPAMYDRFMKLEQDTQKF